MVSTVATCFLSDFLSDNLSTESEFKYILVYLSSHQTETFHFCLVLQYRINKGWKEWNKAKRIVKFLEDKF